MSLGRSIAWAAAWVLALSACGGGGGGDGEQAPAVVIAATAANYWVGSIGSKWSYQLTDARTGATPVLKTVEDQGETVVDGRAVRRFGHSWSMYGAYAESEYRYFDGQAIRRVEMLGAESGVDLGTYDYLEVPAPLHDGAPTTVAEGTQAMDVDGDGVADTVHLTLQVTLGTQATLAVPAGEFHDVLRATQAYVATVTLGGSGRSASATATVTTWYAPGVGVVRRVFVDPSYTAPNNTVTEDLVGVAAGGLRAGTVTGFVALDGIGATDGMGAPELAAGAGRFMTVAASQAGTIEGAIHDDDGTLVWRGTLLSAAAPYRLSGAAVAFDGTDFRVFAVRDIPYNSPTEYAVVGQRIGPSGELRDGPSGAVLDTGVVNNTESLGPLRAASREGWVLLTWGRYDTAYVPVGPGLVTQRGGVIEGRLFDAAQQPAASRFELGSGTPAALAARADQYVVATVSADSLGSSITAWAIGSDGVPVSTTPNVLAGSAYYKGNARLQMLGDEMWLGYSEWNSSAAPVFGATPSEVRMARVGRDAVLLDGTAAAPGRGIVLQDGGRSGNSVALGDARSVLAWSEGWNNVRATPFDNTVLTGASMMPTTASPVAPDVPGGAGPSRSVTMTAAIGRALLVGWLEKAALSDAVRFALVYPRYMAP